MQENKISNVTIGTDPEFFIFSEETGKFVPVCGLVGGTKDAPIPITDKGHAIQEDNVMVEYCIPPASNVEAFIEDINFVKNYIKDTILTPKGLVPKYIGSAIFDFDALQTEQAQEFGCSPDYNAWTYGENKVSRDNMLLRTAGGHIHVGYDNPNADVSIDLVRAMDLFLGVPSIILDTDDQRRIMYGKAGAYRLKKYGVEYRVLSAFFQENDVLIKWVFEQTLKAIEFVNNGGIITNEDEIIACINNSNKELAYEILDDYNIEILQLEVN